MDQERIWDNLYKNRLIWKMETMSLPNVLKGKKVLELGCGSGKTLKAIIKQGPKSLIAIDYSEEAIEGCKKILKNKVNLIKSDARNLPFQDNSFDSVICFYILNNSIKKGREKIIKEIFRVLNDSGKVLFEDFSLGDFRNNGKKHNEENTIIKKNNILCHFFNEKEIRGLFKDFSSIKVKTLSSKPITHKPELKREIISALIRK